MRLIRTNSENQAFIELVRELDAYLAVIDGDEHGFYSQFNKIDKLQQVVVAFEDDEAEACGAIKELEGNIAEVKRMYTKPVCRGKGAASRVLAELEKWASESGYKECWLETGIRQSDAIKLYEKNGYVKIPNYGQYAGIENSVCFAKDITVNQPAGST